MSQSSTLFIGMDVHKNAIAMAYVAQDHGAEVIYLGAIGTRHGDIDKLIRTMQSKAKHLVFVYEAGPCGYWLYRYLTKKDSDCWVVSPETVKINLHVAYQGPADDGLAQRSRAQRRAVRSTSKAHSVRTSRDTSRRPRNRAACGLSLCCGKERPISLRASDEYCHQVPALTCESRMWYKKRALNREDLRAER